VRSFLRRLAEVPRRATKLKKRKTRYLDGSRTGFIDFQPERGDRQLDRPIAEHRARKRAERGASFPEGTTTTTRKQPAGLLAYGSSY
jgi:hypothetical protein